MAMASEISPSMCPPPAADAGTALVPDGSSTTSPPATKHDRDSLSDKELERLTLTLKGDRPKSQKTSSCRTRAASHWYNRSKWEPSTQTDDDDSFFIASPEVLPEDDAGYLCEMCRHIDFAALLGNDATQRDDPDNQASPRKPLRISISKGLERVMHAEDNKCCFCRLLREKIIGDGILDGVSEGEIRLGSFYLNLLDDGPAYARRLEVELETGQRAPRVFTVHRIEEDAQRQKPLSGRVVQQDLANMEYLREWLHLCEETHDDPTQGGGGRGGGLGMTSLRLIDTEELRVRQVDMPARYACLSYVWGKGSQVQYTHATRPKLEASLGLQDCDAPGLPQTIKDAIKVTREVGLRYLWVDALCILQDDPADKASIISKMGPIYSGATLTIVATANTNPHQGLPGVAAGRGATRRPRRRRQTVARVQDGVALAAMLHDPRREAPDIETSVWSSRAWTFQERALSRRAVHFTDSQMVFSCAHTAAAATFEESVPPRDPAFRHPAVEDQAEVDLMMRVWWDRSLGRYPNMGISMGRDTGDLILISEEVDVENPSMPEHLDKLGPQFEITVDPAPVSFMSLSLSPDAVVLGRDDKKPAMATTTTPWDLYRLAVDDYTKRQLSWDADAVDAFTGVEHIIRRGTNTTFWHGLPSFAFENALLWQPDGGFLERRRDPETGAPLFPSWSWAGWRGHVSYRGRGWKNSVAWEPASVVKWLARADPEWMVESFKSRAERTEAEVERYRQRLAAAGPDGLARVLDVDTIQSPRLWGRDGWELVRDEARNRHLYVNETHYPGLSFTYPITLPGRPIEPRQDKDGRLFFLSHAVPVAACDMKPPAPFKPKIEDAFLQIGLNDEHRSANHRPPWQRIVYHQGYRAGFLKLNVPCLTGPSPPGAGDDGCEYRLAAVARSSVSQIPPPSAGWDAYWDTEPRGIQWELFGEEWYTRRDASQLPVQPDETVEPAGVPENENGDPHWDQARFGVQACFDVYDVLLLRTRKGEGVSERVGAGKVSVFAFMAAKPVPTPFRLA